VTCTQVWPLPSSFLGAVLAPDVQVRHPLQSAAGLFRSRWFVIGWVIAVGAWGLHVAALALAPLRTIR
jgi:hypothetical protein